MAVTTMQIDDHVQVRLKELADAAGLDLSQYLQELATNGATQSQPAKKRPSEVRAGDEIGGYVVKTVDYCNDNYAIFRTTKNTLGFQIDPAFPFKNQAESAFHEAKRKVDSQLRGAYRHDANTLLASCLDSCLRAQRDAGIHFQPVDQFITERVPIKHIYGFDTDWAVYTNKDDELIYEYSTLPTKLAPAVTEFNRLSSIAKSRLVEVDQKAMQHILGMDLAAAFTSGEQFHPQTNFLSSRDFINSKVEEKLRATYMLGSVACAVILFLLAGLGTYLLWRGQYVLWHVSLGLLGGVLGATISVMQRGGSLTVNPFVTTPQILLLGLMRIGLGMIFGAVLVVAARADISMGIVKDNMWSLFIFTIVAGFSERFVPDVLGSIGKD